jgi:hypothetical protein
MLALRRAQDYGPSMRSGLRRPAIIVIGDGGIGDWKSQITPRTSYLKPQASSLGSQREPPPRRMPLNERSAQAAYSHPPF